MKLTTIRQHSTVATQTRLPPLWAITFSRRTRLRDSGGGPELSKPIAATQWVCSLLSAIIVLDRRHLPILLYHRLQELCGLAPQLHPAAHVEFR
jgi:hypothetical protein